jgi:hypothetical protein
MTRPSRSLGVAFVLAVVGLIIPVAGQSPIAKYSAQVVSFDSPAGSATGLIQIQITRWSTDEERDRLTNTLFESGGGQKLLDVISRINPPVGSIRTPDSVGYPLRYARRTMAGDAENVVIITERALSFFELSSGSRSRDYPLTVIRFRVNNQNRGEGDILLATKITADKATKDIAFENYSPTALKMQNVRRE